MFNGMLYNTWVVYLDDIISFGQTCIVHYQHLESVFKRLQNANFKLKLSKCSFGIKSVAFFKLMTCYQGISTDLKQLKRIQKWPRP